MENPFKRTEVLDLDVALPSNHFNFDFFAHLKIQSSKLQIKGQSSGPNDNAR